MNTEATQAATPQSAGKTSQGGLGARLADGFAGLTILGLALVLGVLTLSVQELSIGFWPWLGLLILWAVSICVCLVGGVSRRNQVLLYLLAVGISWVLLLTVLSAGSPIVVLLVVMVGIGSYLISLRWMMGIVLLNCLIIFWHNWSQHAGFTESASSTVFYLVLQVAVSFTGYATAQEASLRAELEQKNLELEAAGVLLEDTAAAAERLRISRELHDLIGHQLTVLNLELEAAKHRAGQRGQEHVANAAAVAKDLLADVRSTVGELRESSPADLEHDLMRLAAAVPSIDIDVDVDPGLRVDEDISATMVRVAQEMITNVIKHSEATEMTVTLRHAEGGLVLRGTNDGLAPRRITWGHGLTGLKERLELHGGTLEVTTSPQFSVQAQLPLIGQGKS